MHLRNLQNDLKGIVIFWYFLINVPLCHAGIYTYFVEINRGC